MWRRLVIGHVGNRGEDATASTHGNADRPRRASPDEKGHIVRGEGGSLRRQHVSLNRKTVPAILVEAIAIFRWEIRIIIVGHADRYAATRGGQHRFHEVRAVGVFRGDPAARPGEIDALTD